MAKSNVRSVRMRKVNRALHIQDQLRIKAERHQRSHPPQRARPSAIRRSRPMAAIRRVLARFSKWWVRGSSLSLDLRRDSNIKRAAGANWIRGTWPAAAGHKFVSTRDGRQV